MHKAKMSLNNNPNQNSKNPGYKIQKWVIESVTETTQMIKASALYYMCNSLAVS